MVPVVSIIGRKGGMVWKVLCIFGKAWALASLAFWGRTCLNTASDNSPLLLRRFKCRWIDVKRAGVGSTKTSLNLVLSENNWSIALK